MRFDIVEKILLTLFIPLIVCYTHLELTWWIGYYMAWAHPVYEFSYQAELVFVWTFYILQTIGIWYVIWCKK